jgi:hypothetical protein
MNGENRMKSKQHKDPINGTMIAVRSVVYPTRTLLQGGAFNVAPTVLQQKPRYYTDIRNNNGNK